MELSILSKSKLSFIAIFVVISTFILYQFLDMSGSKFTVRNNTNDAVKVSAVWSEKNKNLGIINPNQIINFSVFGESAMSFVVMYSNGNKIKSEPVYFSTGVMKIEATIKQGAVDVEYLSSSD